MNHFHIKLMAEKISERCGVNEADVQETLVSYWEDMIAVSWHISDIQDYIEETRNITLSDEEAKDVLFTLLRKHDCGNGINWDVIDGTVDYYLAEKENA